MPFIRYISTVGVLHLHEIDAPTRTVPVRNLSPAWQQRIEEINKHRLRPIVSPAERVLGRSLPITSVVINRHPRVLLSNKMPSATPVVDLTGGSDDDERANKSSRSQPNGRVPPVSTRTPHTKYIKSSPSKANSAGTPRPQNGTDELSTPQQTNSGDSQNRKKPMGQDSREMLHSRPRDLPASTLDRAKNDSLRPNKTVVLSDDRTTPKPAFKTPRDYNESMLRQSNGQASESPLATTVTNILKRARDAASPNSDNIPSKKPKFGSRANEHSSQASEGPRQSLEKAKIRSPVKSQQSDRLKNSTEIIDLTGPPRKMQTSNTPTGRTDVSYHSSGQQATSVGVPGQATTSATGALSRHSMSNGENLQKNPSSSQRKDHKSPCMPASEKANGLLSRKESPLNRSHGMKASAPSDVDEELSSPERGPSSRQRKQTAKAKELGINRPPANVETPTTPTAGQKKRTSKEHEDARVNGYRTHTEKQQPKTHSKADSAVEACDSEADESAKATSIATTAKDIANAAPSGTQNWPLNRTSHRHEATTSVSDAAIKNPLPKNMADVVDSRQDPSSTTSANAQKSTNSEAAKVSPKASRPPKGPYKEGNSRLRDSPSVAEQADLQLRTEAMEDIEHGANATVPNPAETFVVPTFAASAVKASALAQLPLSSQVEKVLGKYLEEMRDDREYWNKVFLQRARLAKEDNADAKEKAARRARDTMPRTSFASLKPITLSTQPKKGSTSKSEQLCRSEKIGPNGKGLGVIATTSPFTTFKTTARDVPNYAHYVSIKNNILAPNVTNLHCWPYFGDDFEMDQAHDLKGQYNLDIDSRQEKLLLLQQAQQYETYVESALEDLGCSWADVLRYLIEEKPKNTQKVSEKGKQEQRRKQSIDNFSPTSSRSLAVLKRLPSSTPETLARVAVLCENFEKMAKFDIWHIARRALANVLKTDEDTFVASEEIYRELTCRLCLRFNCPYHGELQEHATNDSDKESTEDEVAATDIVNPPKVNYRTRMAFPPSVPQPIPFAVPSSEAKKKDASYWRSPHLHKEAHDRSPFYPCYHPGELCENAECSCFKESRPCEKICACDDSCSRRFQGCSCAKKGQKCFNDSDCACFYNGRECDPDLCGTCGVCEVVDPVNRYDENILSGKCRNGSIQRGLPKHTLLGDSGVHGLGLYACEDIREHEFVGEYKGEIITKEEADRRGAVYELQKLSYLFSLNATQEIDSTYFGNKVRFINHASGHKANLYARIIMVNTVHRIALYANCSIKSGQEVLFDYGPMFPDEQLGGRKKSKKSAPHVRNANLVREFVDVEESEDEVGNVRAKAVDRSVVGKGKGKARKARGGARPGAGRKPLHRSRADFDDDDDAASAGDLVPGSAEARLAAFNISDDPPIDDLMDVDAGADDEDEYQVDEDSDEISDDGEDSELDSEDEDEGLVTSRRKRSAPRKTLF